MKKQYIYTALIITALLCAGCANEFDNATDSINSAAVELSSVSADPITKAVITGTSFTTDEAAAGIGLFLLDEDGDAYGINPANVRYAYNDGKWTAVQPLRIGGDKGYLYGYYPYSEAATDVKAIPVESSVNGTDWLYAALVEVTTTNAKSISLSLSHALAMVSLSFRLDESYVGDGTLNEISLSGSSVAASGTLDATDGSITALASKFTADTDQTLSKSTSTTLECLVVPISNGSGTPEFTVSCIIDGKFYSKTFTGHIAALAQGSQTTIEFTVLNTSIEVDGSSIGAWGDGGSQTVTVGGDYKVTVKLSEEDAGIDADVLLNVIADKKSVIVSAFSKSGEHLKCMTSENEFCTSQSKTSNLVYTFTISDITSDKTATIGYAKAVSIAVSPENSGSVEITGEAYEGETVILKAVPEYEFGFDAWLDKDGNLLACEEETYSNSVRLSSGGMSVKFKKNLILEGKFTVDGNGKKVCFTRGNLCESYGPKIEQHQYDFNAADYGNGSSRVSHFMWCDNFNDAASQTYVSEWSSHKTFFTEVEGFTVCGLGENQCRTLTSAEWQYLFGDNDNRRGKYRSGVDVCGNSSCVVLLPDDWEWGSNQDKQEYSYVEWKHMEAAGAVCLPAAGYRYGNNGELGIVTPNIDGYYWSSTYKDDHSVFDFEFTSNDIIQNGYKSRSRACSVRLVTDADE